jgi:hypothetical protein
MLENYPVAAQLMAARVVLSSTELVSLGLFDDDTFQLNNLGYFAELWDV